jgi:hypothetical protein
MWRKVLYADWDARDLCDPDIVGWTSDVEPTVLPLTRKDCERLSELSERLFEGVG